MPISKNMRALFCGNKTAMMCGVEAIRADNEEYNLCRQFTIFVCSRCATITSDPLNHTMTLTMQKALHKHLMHTMLLKKQ